MKRTTALLFARFRVGARAVSPRAARKDGEARDESFFFSSPRPEKTSIACRLQTPLFAAVLRKTSGLRTQNSTPPSSCARSFSNVSKYW
jgi:hypothetical protein